jgi:hypothetical protein
MSTANTKTLTDLLWDLTDDSEENAQTGEVTLVMTREQAHEMYLSFWTLGGKYRRTLADLGWTP